MVKGKVNYASKGVSEEVKEHTASFALALESRNVPISIILDSLSETKYAPAARTLRLHMSKLKAAKGLFVADKASGRKSNLSDDQKLIVWGWILDQNKSVNFDAIIEWIKVNFGVEVSKPTLSRYLREAELSVQLDG